MTTWQRARSEDQKAQRVDEILTAAGGVFEEVSYEQVTMQMIAERAKFTRSNLYRYFKTREEIFLTLFEKDSEQWFGDLGKAFSQPKAMKVETFVVKWTDILLKQKRLNQLMPLLAISLEANASEELYRDFKVTMNEKLADVVPLIQKVLPNLSDEQVYEFLTVHVALVSGGLPMSHYSEMQLKVLESENLLHSQVDFEAFYTRAISVYLSGLIK